MGKQNLKKINHAFPFLDIRSYHTHNRNIKGRFTMPKARINISLDADLIQFIKQFAKENRITVADVFTQYVLALKRHAKGEPTDLIMANPAFRQALEEVQTRLKDGTAEWRTMDEVFGN